MEKKDAINKCQYWCVNEPTVCKYWDANSTVCRYKFEAGVDGKIICDAEYAPYCNLIGTNINCLQYQRADASVFYTSRCILPDPSRHVCNRLTGYKWVHPVSVKSNANSTSYTIKEWSFDDINGYENGACDGFGTNITCSGYSPYHLEFGILKPSDLVSIKENKFDLFMDSTGKYIGKYSITEEFEYVLPTNFIIYNIRAMLSKCYWWKGDPHNFTVNTKTGLVELVVGGCSCQSPEVDIYKDFQNSFVKDPSVEQNIGPPCNGCKPECPNYTGVCWQYCVDEKMKPGDPILAEQIHELRYYHRENRWVQEAIEDGFLDKGDIYTWVGIKNNGTCDVYDSGCIPTEYSTVKGTLQVVYGNDGQIESYIIPTLKVRMPSFETFNLEVSYHNLTKGTKVGGLLPNYPTLIREVHSLPLSLIIKNDFKTNPYFEVKQLIDNSTIAIYGKIFYSVPVYAINISDKVIAQYIPSYIFLYDSIYDIERDLSVDQFNEFKIKFSAVIKTIQQLFPDKILNSSVPAEEGVFLLDVPTLFKANTWDGSNNNTVLVFQDIGDYIVYDKATFTKRIIGGVLSQTKFSIRGDGLETASPCDYEAGFQAVTNKNGTLTFKYLPFTSEGYSSTIAYMYNASQYLGFLDKYFYGYVEYTMEADELVIAKKNITIIGSNGYMVININHPYLNSIISPWKVGKIELNYFDTNGVTSSTCVMEIVRHGSDGTIGPQQLLIKPKNMENYKAMCLASDIVVLKKVSYIERRSFGEKPIETEFKIKNSGGKVDTLSKGILTMNDGGFTIDNFQFTLTPTVIITNGKGVPFTTYKTKPIGDVKQVFCPSVEIMFSWGATAIQYDNDPWCRCCGPWRQIVDFVIDGGGKSVPGVTSGGTKCCDHSPSPSQSSGPVWYPFNSCDGYEVYNQIGNHTNNEIDMPAVFQFKTANGEWLHGQHDMRVYTGQKSHGLEFEGCSIFGCSCGMQTGNIKRASNPVFTGWGRVLGHVPDMEWKLWVAYGGVGPKFGNRHRQILRTYRTMDKVISRDDDGNTISKLAPASMVFSKTDITSIETSMWDYRCIIDGPELVNPLGLVLATSFDGTEVNEEIDYVNRFRHDEVFRTTIYSYLMYQKHTQGDSAQVPVYEFKKYPIGDGNTFIQWAWQEPWKELERGISTVINNDFLDMVKSYITNECVGNFKNCNVDNNSVIQSLDVTYPNYRFDYTYKEFRLIPDEGEHKLTIIAPKKDESTGEYHGFLAVQLNNGPIRGINKSGSWLTASDLTGVQDQDDPDSDINKYNLKLYEETSVALINQVVIMQDYTINPKMLWANDVTLFDTGYDNKEMKVAENEKRMVETYFRDGSTGKLMTLKTHFQRGLNVTIINDKWPLKVVLVDQIETITSFEEVICGSVDRAIMTFGFEQVKRSVGRISITFKFGAELVSTGNTLTSMYKYYHQPQVSIYAGGVVLYETPEMVLFNGLNTDVPEVITKTFEWSNSLEYIMDGDIEVTLDFGVTPTNENIINSEKSAGIVGRYNKSINAVFISKIEIFEDILTDVTEDLKIWERKYYVSHGKYGDCPPQGYDGGVLQLESGNVGVWQKDTEDGIVGITGSNGDFKCMSKVRGRFVGRTYPYATELTGDRVSMENEQKYLYDETIKDVVANTIMTGALPPGTRQLLDNAGVSFSGPSDLILENSLLTPLADIHHGTPYASEGYEFRPGQPHDVNCPSNLCADGSAFQYVYYNLDADLGDDIKTNMGIDDSGNIYWKGRFGAKAVRSSNDQYYYGQVPNMDLIESYISLNLEYYPKHYNRDTSNRIYVNQTSKLFFPGISPYSDAVFTITMPSMNTFYDDDGIGVGSSLLWW